MPETVIKDPETGAVLSYEAYIAKMGENITSAYNAAIDAAGTTKQTADDTVEGAYQAAIDNAVGVQTAADAAALGVYNTAVGAAGLSREEAEGIAGTNLANQQADIEAAYRRAQVGYGRQAEGLARAGLTGSGYSDNLTRDAYAARASGNMGAQKAYGEAMLAAQTEEARAIAAAKSAYDLSKASNLAAYNSAEATAAAARDASLAYNQAEYDRATAAAVDTRQRSESDLNAFMYKHSADVESTKQQAYNDILLNVGNMTTADITQLANNAGITGDDLTALLDAQSAVYGAKQLEYYGIESPQDLSILAMDGDASAYQRVQDAIAAGMIQKSDEETYKTAWRSAAEKVFTTENLAEMTKEEAEAALNMYKANGWKDPNMVTKYETDIANAYTPKVKDNVRYTGGRDLATVGKNFKVEVDNSSYAVDSAGEETSASVTSAAKNMADGTVFLLNGKLYVAKKDEAGDLRVYGIKARESSDTGYRLLLSAFSKEGSSPAVTKSPPPVTTKSPPALPN